MKRFKILYIIMALMLSFLGMAAGKAEPIFKKVQAERIFTKTLLTDVRFAPVKHDVKLHDIKHRKDTKYRASCRVQMKRKATPLETTAVHRLYLSEFILIKQFTDNRNYGLSKLYSVALHTYLHLYQLF